MFWVIFDTSTKRDYYRDVHNLLALPSGSMLRYDYNEKHLSLAAVEEAKKGDACARNVLVAYAQTKSFKKGDADPVGPIAYEQGLWVGTRLANLGHLEFSVNRYYFYLKMLEYPAADDNAFGAIMQALAAAQGTPFVKWVAMCDLDAQFDALSKGAASDNWASIVNRIGNSPSQFSGDTFWRIAKIASGTRKSHIQPLLRHHSEVTSGKEGITGVDAVFPITELDRIAFQIESRLPEEGEEPRDKEPEAARTVTFQTAPDGPLKNLNGRTLTLRRYASDWIEDEVGGSDRIDAQLCNLTIKTGPAAGAYPIGPELSLWFQASKKPGRGFFALLSAIFCAVFALVGAASLKEQLEWGLPLIFVGVILGIVAYYLWSGRVKLPGGK